MTRSWVAFFALAGAALGAAPISAASAPRPPAEQRFDAPSSGDVAYTEKLPPALLGVGVDEHLGATLPEDAAFVDETGREVRLGATFDGELPVIVTLNYSRCSMLCSLELFGLVDALRKVDLELGDSYRVLTVSLDPDETPEVARSTRERYLAQYAKPAAARGWHFLTGSEQSIRQLTEAIGFRYRHDPETHQFYHAAAIAIASPDGRLMRYLYGIQFDPQTLRLALVEASRGKIGTTTDKLLLYCCAFDPKQGSYAMVASQLMKLGGMATLVALGTLLLVLWRRDARERQRRTHSPGPAAHHHAAARSDST